MSFNLDIKISYSWDDHIHSLDCDNSPDLRYYNRGEYYNPGDCDCCIFKKMKVIFETSTGPNLEYKFKQSTSFYMNDSDKSNLIKFIDILKEPQKINENIRKSQQKYSQNDSEIKDSIILSKNERLYYYLPRNTLHFDLKSCNSETAKILFDLSNNEISFCCLNYQCCTTYCSCYDCEFYGRFKNSTDFKIPFLSETKEKIISCFESFLNILNEEYDSDDDDDDDYEDDEQDEQ